VATAFAVVIAGVVCDPVTTFAQICTGADSPAALAACQGGSSNGGGNGGNYGGGIIGDIYGLFFDNGPSPAQRAQAKRVAAERSANAVNNQGLEAWKAGNYESAASYFRQALAFTPDDPTIKDNLAQSELKLAAKRDEDQRQAAIKRDQDQRKAAMAASLDRVATALAADQKPAQTVGLDFVGLGPPAAPASAASLEFMATPAATAGGGSRVFGSTNPANPGLSTSTAPRVGVNSALEQLSSAAKSSGDAAKNPGALEASKSVAGCAIGDDACRAPDRMEYPKAPARTQGAIDLTAQVPEAVRGDQQINDNIAYYDNLEKRKIERQALINDVQQQIAKGSGEPVLLKAKMASLDNANKQDDADQAAVIVQLKKRVVDLGRKWEEAPPKSVVGRGDAGRGTP